MSNFIRQKPLILASGSKIRKKLLESLNLDFKVVASDCDEAMLKEESLIQGLSFIEMARLIAKEKALIVSKTYPESYVIAADQVCVQGARFFDKPLTHEVAVENLTFLSGKTHQQIAALCIAKAGLIIWEIQDVANLTMHPLTIASIDAYLKEDKPYQSCGAYQFEGLGKWLFKEIVGSESTILGLPLIPLKEALMNLEIVEI